MKWAFWRRRKPRATGQGRTDARLNERIARAEEPADEPVVRVGQAAQIRVRMRRRLIGAAALLLGTAVVVPMMLDPAPRPLPDNIPIDIPSERTPFSPRLSLPSTARGAEAPGATEGKPSEARSAEPGQGVAAGSASSSAASPAAPAETPKAVDEPPAPATPAGASAAGKWFVQAAALSSEGAARQLSERLSKAGMAPFVERAETGGAVLYRVRLGPFASRDAAVKARRRLRALGIGSNVVRIEQAER
jgi:DedD protein